MSRVRKNATIIVVIIGVALVVLGLIIQTFAGAAGLYCSTAGAVLILGFIVGKTVELDRK